MLQKLYVRIWLAVVLAVAVLTLLVGYAWRMTAEPPLREVVVRNAAGEVIGSGQARMGRGREGNGWRTNHLAGMHGAPGAAPAAGADVPAATGRGAELPAAPGNADRTPMPGTDGAVMESMAVPRSSRTSRSCRSCRVTPTWTR